MLILIIIALLLLVGVLVNQAFLNTKLNHIYTEVAEIHNKMGGWFDKE